MPRRRSTDPRFDSSDDLLGAPLTGQRARAKTGLRKAIGALRVGKLPRQDSNLRPAG